eukprot:362161-Chlamydomonas_euryale.AAC.5
MHCQMNSQSINRPHVGPPPRRELSGTERTQCSVVERARIGAGVWKCHCCRYHGGCSFPNQHNLLRIAVPSILPLLSGLNREVNSRHLQYVQTLVAATAFCTGPPLEILQASVAYKTCLEAHLPRQGQGGWSENPVTEYAEHASDPSVCCCRPLRTGPQL